VLALAGRERGDAGRPSLAKQAAPPAGPANSMPAALMQRFSTLRRAQRADDVLPAAAGERLKRDAYSGENPALARHAQTTSRGRQYFLVPGNGVLCLYDQNPDGGSATQGCVSTPEAAGGHLVGVDLCGPNMTSNELGVYGVVPDGVVDVSVKRSNGSVVRVPVRGNVYAATLRASARALPTSVSWSAADGRHLRPVPLPPGGAPGC